MESNEHKIEKALESLNGIESAKANPYLFTRIVARMEQFKEEPAKLIYVMRFAFLIIGMAVLNLYSINKYSKKEDNTIQCSYESVASEYQLDNNYNY